MPDRSGARLSHCGPGVGAARNFATAAAARAQRPSADQADHRDGGEGPPPADGVADRAGDQPARPCRRARILRCRGRGGRPRASYSGCSSSWRGRRSPPRAGPASVTPCSSRSPSSTCQPGRRRAEPSRPARSASAKGGSGGCGRRASDSGPVISNAIPTRAGRHRQRQRASSRGRRRSRRARTGSSACVEYSSAKVPEAGGEEGGGDAAEAGGPVVYREVRSHHPPLRIGTRTVIRPMHLCALTDASCIM